MSIPLSVAVVGAQWAKEAGGGSTFEEDVLAAAMANESSHRLVVYPANSRMKEVVKAGDVSGRVSLVKAIRDPRIPRRLFRRAKRIVLRRKKPLPFSALSDALRKAGAQCAWMLGGSIVPLDMPYVATIWDLQHGVQPWFPEVSSGGEWRERERLYSEFVRRASAIVVGTSAGAREIERIYGAPPGGAHVIPFPTPSFALFAGSRPRLRRPPTCRHATCFTRRSSGRTRITSPRFACSTRCARCRRARPRARRRGQGHACACEAEAEALGVVRRLHMPGFVSRERLIALYQHADALLYPSLFGPDNLPPLEAMALGCPVIAARVDGAEEQLGDAAILVNPLDPRDYADAVRSLRDYPVRADEMVERGRKRARSWTATEYAREVFSLIDTRIAPFRALWE